MKRWRQTLAVWLGYAVIVAMALLLLVASGSSLTGAGSLGPIVLLAGAVVGAVFAVWGALYELRSDGSERLRRNRQMMSVSFVILIGAVVVWIAWPILPALLRVGLAAAGAGYVLGFLAIFIPNRSRALAIRKIPHDGARE